MARSLPVAAPFQAIAAHSGAHFPSPLPASRPTMHLSRSGHRMSQPLLFTENLTKDYGSFRALADLNLSVAPGEIVGLLGPNGSGKSTALRLLLGFLKPTRGRATIAGFDCWSNSVEARERVAYLPGELR